MHQGSALCPLLFVILIDAVARDLRKPAHWKQLFADGVVLVYEDKHELELQMQARSDVLARFGLCLHAKKIENLTTDVNDAGT
ncbi:hypothetical protein ANCCAN_29437 [Ancylostoma caninum]|uniref:Reverse transcriptase domain-containing protein n=1 Tax=Ancylostoma caninum TaxID=29170 RepID=A0A368EZP8_ANCCA|nr:hypothetical protein ANCCAN_29437 [Ancylostoma caninum]